MQMRLRAICSNKPGSKGLHMPAYRRTKQRSFTNDWDSNPDIRKRNSFGQRANRMGNHEQQLPKKAVKPAIRYPNFSV